MEKISSDYRAKLDVAFASDEVKSLIEKTKSADASSTGTFEVVITTENLDRYNEVISMDGWDLTHYLNNPVVLWGHDHNRIIGVATSVEVRDGKMVASGKFAPTEEGQEKRKLYDEGFLRATSVGFIEKEREGNLITQAELIEFSFVSVPANPYALSLALQHERSIDELVTKGIFSIKDIEDDEKDSEKDSNEPEAVEPEEAVIPEEPAEPVEDEEPTDHEEIAKSVANLVIKELEIRGALEVAEESEPEGTEDGEEESDPDVKAFENKRVLQRAATILGDVLAEARKAKTQ